MKATHIDTCLSCYLQDHHNRPGELLLGVWVDGTLSYQALMEDLIQELHSLSVEDESFDYEAAEAAIREQFSTVSDMSKPFDSSLEIQSEADRDDCLEWPHAWFLLEWEEAS